MAPNVNDSHDDEIGTYTRTSNLSHHRTPSECSQDSIDRLYTVVHQGTNRSADYVDDESLPPPINEYVTMDQALEMRDDSSVVDENQSISAASNLAVAGDLDRRLLGEVCVCVCGMGARFWSLCVVCIS